MKHSLKVKTSQPNQTTLIHFSIHEVLEKHLPNLLHQRDKRYAIIMDSKVKNLYAKFTEHLDITIFSFPSGEASKTRETKAMLEDSLLSHSFGRDSCLIALGGGVTCDLVGFVASTYCRGISLLLIPTSLLAMVDAAIGGKTGVNTLYGKNTIGTFYPAEQVFIDGAFLQTLPPEEMRNGASELIKYGLIASKELFDYLREKRPLFEEMDMRFLMKIIRDGISIKSKILKEDLFEKKNKRIALNYGHTIGHAIEKLEKYTLSHGEAIAIGMIVSAYMSVEMGFLAQGDLEQIENLFREYKLNLKLPKAVNFDEFLSTVSLDKKARKGIPRFVLLKAIGELHPFEGEYCTPVPLAVLEAAFTWMNKHFALNQI